jgi:hypothetical protein
MAYPLLKQEVQLQQALVEWKHCHRCCREYEGGKCPFCHSPYSPSETPLIGRDWLVIPGVYEEVRRWGCGPKESRHYSPQDLCREIRIVEHMEDRETPLVRYRVRHHPGGRHDCCLLDGCRERGPCRHAERGTTLWVRANRFPRRDPAGPGRLGLADALDEGMARALAAWDVETRRRLHERFGDDRVAMAEALAQEVPSSLSAQQLQQLKGCLQQALADHDIDEDV